MRIEAVGCGVCWAAGRIRSLWGAARCCSCRGRRWCCCLRGGGRGRRWLGRCRCRGAGRVALEHVVVGVFAEWVWGRRWMLLVVGKGGVELSGTGGFGVVGWGFCSWPAFGPPVNDGGL